MGAVRARWVWAAAASSSSWQRTLRWTLPPPPSTRCTQTRSPPPSSLLLFPLPTPPTPAPPLYLHLPPPTPRRSPSLPSTLTASLLLPRPTSRRSARQRTLPPALPTWEAATRSAPCPASAARHPPPSPRALSPPRVGVRGGGEGGGARRHHKWQIHTLCLSALQERLRDV